MENLRQLFNRPSREINLAEAALHLAKEEYPDLSVGAYLKRLDDLSASVRRRLQPGEPAEKIISAMNQLLFHEERFAGNHENYYDPRNSFLNEVLDRRIGIPITLSIVYMEVGERLGLAIEGVSFPGHFLVKLEMGRHTLVLDPYSGGVSLGKKELTRRLRQFHSDELDVPLGQFLVRTRKKEILIRMLRNLKGIYLRKEDYTRALSVVSKILLVRPNLPEELRDRGLLFEHLECGQSALQDYRRYLELDPDAPDARKIRHRIINMGKTTPSLH